MSESACAWSPGTEGSTATLPAPPTRTRSKRRRRGATAPPPSGIDGGDDDGGGGRGDGEPAGPDGEPTGAAELALALLLFGITVLFATFLAVWVLMRGGRSWPPPGSPAPPDTLWLSTAFLVASSVTMVLAVRARRTERARAVHRLLAWSLVLGSLFLATQVFLWRALAEQGFVPASSGYGALFYALTGLHAVHVAVGMAYLLALWFRSSPRRPAARRAPSRAVRLGAVYWHFMGAIWLVLFGVLYFLR